MIYLLDEIEITPAMIEAGICAIRELPLGGRLEEIVTAAFVAMQVAAHEASVSASLTSVSR
ncbi:hypothetical protein MAXJ12_13201 [Mesorhizobium alhagi CCNWXJ12-2]|uniref:Uncharacterized protein n=1 Tax=Mesorhizobium alhagi CCNWXJ12-2 TaxID=1107882 RepID=H0HR57_9HYPH|nr:hypothetical protein MAXJ12_13201 [Mesorhizobium alhagi CCNWXJ12-2]